MSQHTFFVFLLVLSMWHHFTDVSSVMSGFMSSFSQNSFLICFLNYPLRYFPNVPAFILFWRLRRSFSGHREVTLSQFASATDFLSSHKHNCFFQPKSFYNVFRQSFCCDTIFHRLFWSTLSKVAMTSLFSASFLCSCFGVHLVVFRFLTTVNIYNACSYIHNTYTTYIHL